MLNETLHLVAGLEALLVRRGEPLTATFARRYSVLAAHRDAREYEVLGRALYGLRSDLVHGREIANNGEEERAEFLKQNNRTLTCMMARRTLRWFASRAGIEIADFHAALDGAFDNHQAFDALRPVLSDELS
jgi:DNA polymerase III epsilon subunit-like protein